jgi:hypothetical protein
MSVSNSLCNSTGCLPQALKGVGCLVVSVSLLSATIPVIALLAAYILIPLGLAALAVLGAIVNPLNLLTLPIIILLSGAFITSDAVVAPFAFSIINILFVTGVHFGQGARDCFLGRSE